MVKRLERAKFMGSRKWKKILFRSDRSVKASRKTKRGGIMLLMPKNRRKTRPRLKYSAKKYDSLLIELETASKENERTILLNISYNPSKISQYEIMEKLARSHDYWHSFTTKIILFGDYNLRNKLENIHLQQILHLTTSMLLIKQFLLTRNH